jgi:sugar phosphate isomerase/epimerase
MFQQKLPVKKFIEELVKVCEDYGFSIGHEDTHGAFKINNYTADDIEWLRSATDCTK